MSISPTSSRSTSPGYTTDDETDKKPSKVSKLVNNLFKELKCMFCPGDHTNLLEGRVWEFSPEDHTNLLEGRVWEFSPEDHISPSEGRVSEYREEKADSIRVFATAIYEILQDDLPAEKLEMLLDISDPCICDDSEETLVVQKKQIVTFLMNLSNETLLKLEQSVDCGPFASIFALANIENGVGFVLSLETEEERKQAFADLVDEVCPLEDMETIFSAIKAMDDKGKKNNLFERLCFAFTMTGNFDNATRVALMIDDMDLRATVFFDIITTKLIVLDNRFELMKFAEIIQVDEARGQSLLSIFYHLIQKNDRTRIEEFAYDIPEHATQTCGYLTHIAEGLAKLGFYERAESFANAINNSFLLVETIDKIHKIQDLDDDSQYVVLTDSSELLEIT